MRLRKFSFLFLFLAVWVLPGSAQERDIRAELRQEPLRYGGSSAPYLYSASDETKAPCGYKPFYISHFGRHGSRFHTTASLCPSLSALFARGDSLQILTELGRTVYDRIRQMDSVSEGRAGDLTEVGEREHREIALRMVRRCPRVFSGKGVRVLAEATTSPRVIVSMAAFCEALKTAAPGIEIHHEAGERSSAYLNHYTAEYREYYQNGPWREIRDNWLKGHLAPAPVISRLFRDASPVGGNPGGSEARKFVQNLYSLAKITAASGFDFSLYEAFTEDELFVLWQSGNMDQYMRKGPSAFAETLAPSIAKPLLADFVREAEAAVRGEGPAVKLRFGHGEGIMPLAALMRINEASQVCSDPDRMADCWQDYRITTMAANIQWIFYRNPKGKVLVKILLNEREASIPVPTDTWPYYAWEDVRDFYHTIID